MAFKPDIDFSELLEHEVMGCEQLEAIFGRVPTSGDLRWAIESFRSKHPEQASLVRSERKGGPRLYLMPQRQGKQFREKRVASAVKGLQTESDLYVRLPTSKLTDEERREHRLTCDTITQAKISEMNLRRRALPKQSER